MVKKKDDTVQILRPERKIADIVVLGISPLIVHRFSEKSKKQMADKHAKTAKKGREVRDTLSELVYATHFIGPVDREALVDKMKKDKVVPGDDITKYFKKYKVGFPATGFKQCAVAACRAAEGITLVYARGAFFILNDMVEIRYKKAIFREDTVRLASGAADLRYRPAFVDWGAKLEVEVDPQSLSLSQVANLIAVGGSKVGVGEWRPTGKTSTGDFGRFHLADSELKIEKVEKTL